MDASRCADEPWQFQCACAVVFPLEDQRKEMKMFGAFIVFGVLAWIPVDMQMNHGNSNAHAQWFSHWKIRADDHDVMI